MINSKGGVILAAPQLSGRPGFGCVRDVCTSQGFGRVQSGSYDGGNGLISFDQRWLQIKAVPERAAAHSSNGCVTPQGVTNSRQDSTQASLDLDGREFETVTPPKPAQCCSDIGRG